MSECMLKHCKLHELRRSLEEEWAEAPAEPKTAHEFPGGSFYVAGELCADPFEMEIDLLKAGNAEEWLTSVLVRHINRVQGLDEELVVLAEMG